MSGCLVAATSGLWPRNIRLREDEAAAADLLGWRRFPEKDEEIAAPGLSAFSLVVDMFTEGDATWTMVAMGREVAASGALAPNLNKPLVG